MPHKKKYDVVTTFLNYDLHGAAAAGNIGLVVYAISHGQPINAVLGGLLPIHAAASGGSVEVVQFLIEQGADVNIPRLASATGPPINVGGAGHLVGPAGILGPDGHPLASGEKLHKTRMGSAMGNSGPTPSTSSNRPGSASNASTVPVGRRGSTPLHFAAAMGHMEVIKLLLENGADPSAKDVEKSTPEMVARSTGRGAVGDFLRDWELYRGAGSTRRSLDTPQSAVTPASLRPDAEFGFAAGNHSTASLPLSAGAPAAQSTSSLGRYTNQPSRRPSLPFLPSINESPPTTSYPRPGSKKQTRSVERPATASTTTTLPRLPFSIRRPKSAGNRDGQSAPVDDGASQVSHYSGKDHPHSSGSGATQRLQRIFKKNLRPATASGALSTSSSSTTHSPPVVTRSRSPSASKVSDKERSGGFFHGHLPHLPHRRDHLHPHHHISRDAISGPIPNGQSPATSIPDLARPDLVNGGSFVNAQIHGKESPPYDTLDNSQDDLRTEDEIYKTLNLSQAEIQYAMSRGTLPDRDRVRPPSSRTAPPTQTTFGPKKKISSSAMRHHPSYSTLSAKPSPSMTPSPGMVPRHRAHLGPGGGLAMTTANYNGSYEDVGASRAQSPLSIGSSTVEQPLHVARPVPSSNSLNHTINAADEKDVNGSISSSETNLTGTSGSNDMLRSPDDPILEHPTRPMAISTGHSSPFSPGIYSAATSSTSPSVSSAGYATMPDLYSPGGVSSPMTFIDGVVISSRAQAVELAEAQKRAIQIEHKERLKARRLASASSHRNQSSPMLNAAKNGGNLASVDGQERKVKGVSTPNADSDDSDVPMGEEELEDFREKLAALGETVQMERKFAKGEQQARKWYRDSALDDGSTEGALETDMDRMGGPASMGVSMLSRTELLEGYLRQGSPVPVETVVVKRPATPKRDVFGRPVTPKQREGRPPTPKENRPTTPKLPSSSRSTEAPRGNRVLPPPSKTPPRPTQHLTLQQTRAISKSDLAIGSHINKDDLQGRERAWTTTDVRPRLGPASASRPSTAGARPSEPPKNGGLTIDIIQTMPTPTDGPTTPLRKASPMTPTTPSSQTSTTIQSRRRCASNPLRIDAKAAQDIDSRENMPAEGGSKPGSSGDSSLPEQQHVSRPSRSRKPSTPTRSKQEPILLQRITPPVVPPVISLVPPEDVPSSSFRSVSTNQDIPDSPIPAAPVPTLPSAVDLHNMHMQRAKEEARKLLDSPVSPAVSSETGHSAGGWKNSPPYATVHGRPTGGVPGRNEFGYESVRSFTEERGGEKSWMLKQIDTIDSDPPVAGKTRSKLGGLFSRLKR